MKQLAPGGTFLVAAILCDHALDPEEHPLQNALDCSLLFVAAWIVARSSASLTSPHFNHDPPHKQSLAVLCRSGHSKNDTPQRIAMTRRTWAQRRGQYWLKEEIRLAPFPVRTWPIQLRQLDLF